jgi:hypothetical protein
MRRARQQCGDEVDALADHHPLWGEGTNPETLFASGTFLFLGLFVYAV